MRFKILFLLGFFSVFLINFSEVFARAGGSSSSSSSDGEGFIGAIFSSLIFIIYKIRRMKLIKKAKTDLENALKDDSSWDLKILEETTKNIFFKYQDAWQEKNLSSLEKFMTKDYFKKANKLLEKELSGKKNILENIEINNLTLMSVKDLFGKDGDMFAMEVSGKMIDYVIDEETGDFLYSKIPRGKNESLSSYSYRAKNQSFSFKDYYIFMRYNNVWLLQNVKDKFGIADTIGLVDVIGLKEFDIKNILKKERGAYSLDKN